MTDDDMELVHGSGNVLVLLRCFLTAKVTHSLGGVRLPRNRTGLQPIVPVRRRQPSGLS